MSEGIKNTPMTFDSLEKKQAYVLLLLLPMPRRCLLTIFSAGT